MKRSSLLRVLFIIFFAWVFFVLGSSSHSVTAQVADTASPTEMETPSPTPEPPNLAAAKENDFLDRNDSGSIDAGDGIRYTIIVTYTGAQPVEVLLRDRLNLDYFELKLEDHSEECIINGEFIECSLDLANTTTVEYTLTLRDSLDFQGSERLQVSNLVAVLFRGTPLVTAAAQFWVNAPTATITPTQTITPSPTITLSPTATLSPTFTPPPANTPTPTPIPPPPGAPALQQGWVTVVVVALLALIGIAVFTFVGAIAKIGGKDEDSSAAVTATRVAIFREGTIIVFIVSAVLLMGIAGTLPSDGVISILSAIVGYVFGRASAR